MGTIRTMLRAVLLGLVLLLTAAACGSSGGGDPEEGQDMTLTVFAAASLTSTFTEIGAQFEAEHDGVEVRLSFGGSSDLVEQIKSGAPADVFASADTVTMDRLGDIAVEPRSFASNTLQIAVPPGNPAGVSDFADLAQPDVKLVVCAPVVPCGAATKSVADAADVRLSPVSQEQSVTDVLGKVATGEADAGLVYVSNVLAAGDAVEGIAFREAASVVNVYPIARVKGAEHAELAQEFIDLVLSAQGQQVLGDAGFGQPASR